MDERVIFFIFLFLILDERVMKQENIQPKNRAIVERKRMEKVGNVNDDFLFTNFTSTWH